LRTADPGGPSLSAKGEKDVARLKSLFPFLKGFSDTFIQNTGTAELMKIESTALKIRDAEKGREAVDRLTTNKQALSSTFYEIKPGKDNRCDVIDDSRYLPPEVNTAAKQWLRARQCVPLTGYPPVSSYDMGAVGLAGLVSAKGWCEIHNPASNRLSVRQFNIADCRSKAASGKENKEGSVGGFNEVAELQLALRTMRTAMTHVMSWNFSIQAIESFLIQNKFFLAELSGVDKPALFLIQFVDYVLEQNSERWRDSTPFLSTGELKATWEAYHQNRPHTNNKRTSTSSQPAASKMKKGIEARVQLGICFKWNRGLCTKAKGQCKTTKGKDLRHVCDFTADPNKPLDVCGKEHIRKDFN